MSRRPYIRPMSTTTWYMRNGRYKVYVLRELSSFLVAFYTFLDDLRSCGTGGLSGALECFPGLAAMYVDDNFPWLCAAVFPVFPDFPLVQTGAQGNAGTGG